MPPRPISATMRYRRPSIAPGATRTLVDLRELALDGGSSPSGIVEVGVLPVPGESPPMGEMSGGAAAVAVGSTETKPGSLSGSNATSPVLRAAVVAVAAALTGCAHWGQVRALGGRMPSHLGHRSFTLIAGYHSTGSHGAYRDRRL
jgi:hypothetical protein